MRPGRQPQWRIEEGRHGFEGDLSVATADEGGVVVVDFARQPRGAAQRGCSRPFRRLMDADEPDVADQVPTPGTVDLRAEVLLDGLKVFLPRSSVGSDLKMARLAADGTRMRSESFPDNLRPSRA